MINSVATQGLVIREPWIAHLCAGRKTWEMRTKATYKRGPIALIKAGSGLIVATATIADVLSPLDPATMPLHFDKHRIPPEIWRMANYSWFTPWVLTDIRSLARPIRYTHPSGAVTWVNLEASAIHEIAAQLGSAEASGRLAPGNTPTSPLDVRTNTEPRANGRISSARSGAFTNPLATGAAGPPKSSAGLPSDQVTARHRFLAKRALNAMSRVSGGINFHDDTSITVTRRGSKVYVQATWDDATEVSGDRLRRAMDLIGTIAALAVSICMFAFFIHFTIGVFSGSVSALVAFWWLVPMAIATVIVALCGQGHLLDDMLGKN